jgi:hypothetical protein
MTPRRPADRPAAAPAAAAVRPLIPQPHGGALRPGAGRGPKKGAANAGRPPSAVRAVLRESFADRVPLLERIADDDTAPMAERLRALEVLARYGLGTADGIDLHEVRERLRATVDAIRTTLPDDVAAPLLWRLRAIWTAT